MLRGRFAIRRSEPAHGNARRATPETVPLLRRAFENVNAAYQSRRYAILILPVTLNLLLAKRVESVDTLACCGNVIELPELGGLHHQYLRQTVF